MADTRDTAERALAEALGNTRGWYGSPAMFLNAAKAQMERILSDPAARRAINEATREPEQPNWETLYVEESERYARLSNTVSTPSPDDATGLRAHEKNLVAFGRYMLAPERNDPAQTDYAEIGRLAALVINGIPAVRAALAASENQQ